MCVCVCARTRVVAGGVKAYRMFRGTIGMNLQQTLFTTRSLWRPLASLLCPFPLYSKRKCVCFLTEYGCIAHCMASPTID